MTRLELILSELLMREAFPCDLGDGIEVVHDVETVEIEMECDLGDDSHRWFDEEFARTLLTPVASRQTVLGFTRRDFAPIVR